MKNLLLQKRAEHQNHNSSLEYNHQKARDKSQEKDKDYLKSKIDETYGKKKFKLNYFNLQLYNGDNQIPEIKNNYKYRNIKRMIKKEQIYVKEKKIKKKENSKENINTNNLTKTEFNYNYNIHTNIAKYFKNCNGMLKKYSEIESHLETLWKKMGVNDNYINAFNSCKNMLINSDEREIYMISEIENIEKFKDIIINLTKEIEMREIKLIEIKNIFEKINKESDPNSFKRIISESNYVILSYIENTIRVLEYYLLYKEFLNQGSNKNNKYNEEIIKKNFGLNKYDININYLLKMKIDTNFLNTLKINELKINKDIFNLFKGDPFFSCLNNIIQIPQEIKDKIKYCQHYLIQEGIIESLNKTIKEIKTNSERKNSQTHIKIDAKMIKKNLNSNYNSNKHNNKTLIEESKNPEENINNNSNPNININDNSNININNINTNINENSNININNANTVDNNINDNLNISYYSGKMTEFIPIYSEYYQKIPEEQKTIFNLKEDPLKYFEHNYYPKIIICKDKITNVIKGMCIYSILFKSYEKKPNEIILEHISSYNKEEMENILTKMIEFIKENHILKNLCRNSDKLNTEIYIDLYYFLVNEKFDIDKNIRDFIGKKLKFKWVKLENISKVIRFQKMKHVINFQNEDNNIDENNYKLCCNFSIKDNSVINFIKKLEKINNNLKNSEISIIKKINPFNIFYIVFLLKKIFNIKNIFENLLSKINSFTTTNKLLLESINENNNELNYYTLPSDLKIISNCFNGNLYDELYLNNKIDIFPLFDGCISTKYRNYYYNRIECKNIKIVKENITGQKFYLIKAVNNGNISILMSSDLNDNFKNKYISDNTNENNPNINISLNFKEIYSNLAESEIDEQNMKNNYIYIPAFSMEQKCDLNNNNEIINEENVLKNYDEEYKIEFLSEELIMKKNNKNNKNFEFDLIENEINNNRDIIINDEFMVFILDSDVFDTIGIIPIISIDVKKDYFISCENN